jgi:hypothetical protein
VAVVTKDTKHIAFHLQKEEEKKGNGISCSEEKTLAGRKKKTSKRYLNSKV